MQPDQRALFLSLRPRFAELLLDGRKTIEVRRTQPKIMPGGLVLLYASSPTRALVGTAAVTSVSVSDRDDIWARHGALTGLSRAEYDRYLRGATAAVAIALCDLSRLPQPFGLPELRRGRSWFRPPQSFCYLDAKQVASLGLGESSSLNVSPRRHLPRRQTSRVRVPTAP